LEQTEINSLSKKLVVENHGTKQTNKNYRQIVKKEQDFMHRNRNILTGFVGIGAKFHERTFVLILIKVIEIHRANFKNGTYYSFGLKNALLFFILLNL